MFLIDEIKRRRRAAERKRIFRIIRECMVFFGYNLSDLTDEQIEEGILKTAELMRQSALTIDDFQRVFNILSEAGHG